MGRWDRPDPVEARRRAAANLTKIYSGGYARERYEAEKRKAAEKAERQYRAKRRKEITGKLKVLRADLKDQQSLYKSIEADRADIGIKDAAHKQGALEEVDYQIENITIRINKLLDEKETLR